MFALQILEQANQRRFKFKRTSNRVPATVTKDEAAAGVFRAEAEVWAVEFEEKQSGTLIKTERLRDLPSRGRFWIDPLTGRVLMSELIAKNRQIAATVDVSYQSEPLVGFLVPVEMRENYQDRRGASRVASAGGSGSFRSTSTKISDQK